MASTKKYNYSFRKGNIYEVTGNKDYNRSHFRHYKNIIEVEIMLNKKCDLAYYGVKCKVTKVNSGSKNLKLIGKVFYIYASCLKLINISNKDNYETF